MSSYILRAAEPVKDLEAQGDRPPLTVWTFTLSDQTGTEVEAEAVKRQDFKPTIGGALEGDIEESNFGPKFKPAKKGGFGGNARSPEEKKRIERMACHKSAVALAGHAITLGLLDGKVKDKDQLFNVVRQLADDLEADLP